MFVKFLSKNTTEQLKEAQTLIYNDILLSDKMKCGNNTHIWIHVQCLVDLGLSAGGENVT